MARPRRAGRGAAAVASAAIDSGRYLAGGGPSRSALADPDPGRTQCSVGTAGVAASVWPAAPVGPRVARKTAAGAGSSRGICSRSREVRLDEIEYVTGSTTTSWGARRAADGYPAPF